MIFSSSPATFFSGQKTLSVSAMDRRVWQQQPIDLAHILFLLVTATDGIMQQPGQVRGLNSSLWRLLDCHES